MSRDEATSSDDEVKEDEPEVSTKSKGKKGSKKSSTAEKKTDEETQPSKDKSKRGTKKSKKGGKSSAEEESEVKVPLLDQPEIIEGIRNRKTVVSFESEIVLPLPKRFQIEIPNGRGIPLGRINVINTRLTKLRPNLLKELHRALFGKVGKPANFITNFQKFRGFPFSKDSEDYNQKLVLLNKFHVSDLDDLLFCFDLDMKTKRKEDAVKRVLDFLLSPKPSEKPHRSAPSGHPKRKATKRNYYDFDVDEDIISKKKKKSKVSNKSTDEKEESEVKENGEVETKSRTKKRADKEDEDDSQSPKNDDSETDNHNELKKPAKKRKRNQVIEETEELPEEVEETKETKSKKKKSTAVTKKKGSKKSASKGSDDSLTLLRS